jgi:hypothetical protein
LDTLLSDIIGKALIWGYAGALIPIALAGVAFYLESQQSETWFKNKQHVDNFFIILKAALASITVAMVIAAAANIEEIVVAASFAAMVVLSAKYTWDSVDRAQREQDSEYSRKTP